MKEIIFVVEEAPEGGYIPAHDPLKVGMLAAILADVAAHGKMNRDYLIRRLWN